MIKNKAQLVRKNPLRRAPLEILETGLNAVEPKEVVGKKMSLDGSILHINDHEFDLNNYERVILLGFGKASLKVAQVVNKILGRRLTSGVVIDVSAGRAGKIECLQGDHPYATARNVSATKKLLQLVKKVTAKDLILVVVSGGGSALLSLATTSERALETRVLQSLYAQDASIRDINIIRRHLSELRGGGLAVKLYPATVVGLIFSDTPGFGPETVASGPTYLDKTTIEQAKKISTKYKLGIETFKATPRERKFFAKVTNVVMLGYQDAIEAMTTKAKLLGLKPVLLERAFSGEARELGRKLTKTLKSGQILIAGGETGVSFDVGSSVGEGGRNQELVLGSLVDLPSDMVVISCGSDGHDNSPAAGAIGDDTTLRQAEKKRVDPLDYLKRHDSYNFFKAIGDSIITGQTGTNVSDLLVILKK